MAQYYNSSNKRGELFELQEELNSTDFQRKKEAIKKVIAHMTIGKDVSGLFQSVIKCLEFNDIELKKLVYLYIINYSKNRPDEAIMVIQLFRKDIQNKGNPLLRALAVRTMGCLRVHKLNEYLIQPLKESLNDSEPYVRKTAALCIPKLYEVSPELIHEHGVIDAMQTLLQKEGNPLVLSNLILGLQDISSQTGLNLIAINTSVLQRLLVAVNECMEWGQTYIMDFLATYVPENEKEAETILERILPRLSHKNPAVVLAAVKIIIKYLDLLTSAEVIKLFCQKLTSSLVSLLSWDEYEIKFIILRNIQHILAKRRDLLSKDIKCFFCNFNEPYYIKNEKLKILSYIADSKNYDLVINELRLYVSEPDPNFVAKSIRALAHIAIKFPKSVEKVLSILIEYIKSIKESKQFSQSQQIQEIVISLQKIYRKYPTRIEFENGLKEIMEVIEQSIDTYEEQAKAAAVYLIGEFAEEIPRSIELITNRIDSFLDEQREVQLDTLTAAVKVFVKYPDDGKVFIKSILETAAYKTQNPDVRDRAFIYWRMLSSNPEKAKDTVLCQKPEIQEEDFQYEQFFLESMINTMGLITSVFHKTEQDLFRNKDSKKNAKQQINQQIDDEDKEGDIIEKSDEQESENKNQNTKQPQLDQKGTKEAQEDLFDLYDDEPQPKIQQQQQTPVQQNNQVQQQQQEENLLDLF